MLKFNQQGLGGEVDVVLTLSMQADGTLKATQVAGANTTATITSTTSLATETTNTVVSINTGNDRTPSDFVINVEGPLARPTVTTGRGPSNAIAAPPQAIGETR